VPWAAEVEQQLSRIAHSGCKLSAQIRIFGAGLLEAPGTNNPIPGLRLKFEVARQASCPSLSASVRAVPWADEADQQLSRIAHSGCKLSGDVRIFRAGLRNLPSRDPLRYVSSLRWKDKQEPPVSVPLCEQCHGQLRLSNSFPG